MYHLPMNKGSSPFNVQTPPAPITNDLNMIMCALGETLQQSQANQNELLKAVTGITQSSLNNHFIYKH